MSIKSAVLQNINTNMSQHYAHELTCSVQKQANLWIGLDFSVWIIHSDYSSGIIHLSLKIF